MSRFLLFYRHCDPRDLHSFPTRRSSDLCWLVSECWCFHRRRRHTASQCDSRFRKRIRRRRQIPTVRRNWPSSAPCIDRKSTRLNSSHVAISYAVFCLKKKKHEEIDHTRL